LAKKSLYVGIDIGAGAGAKLGLFDEAHVSLGEDLLATKDYGDCADSLADALEGKIKVFLKAKGFDISAVRSCGIATPGLLRSDGAYLLAQNLPYLNGKNLPALLSERTGVPVGIENDANTGGLAEWSILKTELIYWVYGGGWGGTWISGDGNVRFPALDWDGNDASLHYTNEPGYAIPLEKITLKMLFLAEGVSYERFEYNLIEELQPEDGVVRGPSGSTDHLRAEIILSGVGRCRLFRAAVGHNERYKRFLEMSEAEMMEDPTVAGKYISKLSSLRVEASVITDRLFGKILAEATRILLKQAEKDGCPPGVPICLGGKPSYALPYFGPSAQREIGKMGFMNYLRPSVIDEIGSNANLVGACVVAEKAYMAKKA